MIGFCQADKAAVSEDCFYTDGSVKFISGKIAAGKILAGKGSGFFIIDQEPLIQIGTEFVDAVYQREGIEVILIIIDFSIDPESGFFIESIACADPVCQVIIDCLIILGDDRSVPGISPCGF